jgi:hypothetical protein
MRSTLLVCLLFAACAEEVTGLVPDADGLALASATPARVRGFFVHDGTTVVFDSARSGDVITLELTTVRGQSLIRIATLPAGYEIRYLDGKLVLRTPRPFAESGIVLAGDGTALDELAQLPEMAALPHLSRALGARGLTGAAVPSTLALHKIAREASHALAIDVAQLDVDPSAGGGLIRDDGCQAYPNSGDNCYGMCGNGCSCWSWVCGDCCYHNGCARHDSYCRGSGWADKAKCWTAWGASFFGC